MSTKSISNCICLTKTEIRFSHEECTEITYKIEGGLSLKEEVEDCNTLTKFEIFTELNKYLVYFNWSNSYTLDVLSFHLAEDNNILFLATNRVIYTINLDNNLIQSSSYDFGTKPMLFWRFVQYSKYILALCEMEVVVFDLEGKFIKSSFAEPPYNIRQKDSKIIAVNEIDGSEFDIVDISS